MCLADITDAGYNAHYHEMVSDLQELLWDATMRHDTGRARSWANLFPREHGEGRGLGPTGREAGSDKIGETVAVVVQVEVGLLAHCIKSLYEVYNPAMVPVCVKIYVAT